MGRDYLAELPPRFREEPGWQFLAEMLRLDPSFRDVYLAEGAGGFSIDLPPLRLGEAVAALRTLPDDAGSAAADAVLAPLRSGTRDDA